MEKVYLEGNIIFHFCEFWCFDSFVLKDSVLLEFDVVLLGKVVDEISKECVAFILTFQEPVPHSRRLESPANSLKVFCSSNY